MIMLSLSVWKPELNLATSAESWITAGDPQHTVLSTRPRSTSSSTSATYSG